ncbi:helix-turn-helix domain-containing protein [Pseudomonas sp. PS02290]|uniref:helix-turn-helix domain-containing protein n=1 Tax=Pseudomonas sp. PS02290 TaxID=2991430 RepID=UPI00249A42D8|nr:helix-turn-helix transcriptional regulator [Pseudomonas sp. PS02290]
MAIDLPVSSPSESNSNRARGPRRGIDPDMQGITRDLRKSNPSDAGWRVRLMKGRRYVADRHFRDQAYGGSQRALRAARCYRDDMAKEHGIVLTASSTGALAQLRRTAEMTQLQLARVLRVSSAQIAKWERGEAPVALLKLAGAIISGQVICTSVDITAGDIRRIRTQLLKWTQHQLAIELDRAYAAIGQWERGTRRAPGWVLVYLQAINDGWNTEVSSETFSA